MNIKINGRDHEIPTKWREVSFGQFLQLAESGSDTAKILSIFTGVEEETIRTAKIKGIDKVLSVLSFLSTDMDNTLPKTCLGHTIPVNLEFESIGQFEDIKAEYSSFKGADMESVAKYVNLVAIYAVSPYNYQEAEKLAPKFMAAPCEEVLAIGNFTAMKLIELNLHIKPNTPRQPATLLRRFRLVLKAWLSRSAFTIRYYSWKRKLRTNETSLKSGA